MRNRLLAVAGVVVATGVAGCAQPQTMPRKAAHLTIDGATHATRPAACSQEQAYRTIDIRDRGGRVEAVVLLSGARAIPQWVKIRDVDGFTGSYWEGGVGEVHAEATNDAYTISGSAYGISSSNPNKVVTTDFKIAAEC
ncbi:lipoprotein LpqH [Mycobacterium sp. HUMS_1102779]|uniref:lipoprotein LpqH n=1 Tax=Mycobacterium sp. HUMS_1102779 TaxID=3383487 RepID=UPI00389A47D6